MLLLQLLPELPKLPKIALLPLPLPLLLFFSIFLVLMLHVFRHFIHRLINHWYALFDEGNNQCSANISFITIASVATSSLLSKMNWNEPSFDYFDKFHLCTDCICLYKRLHMLQFLYRILVEENWDFLTISLVLVLLWAVECCLNSGSLLKWYYADVGSEMLLWWVVTESNHDAVINNNNDNNNNNDLITLISYNSNWAFNTNSIQP